MRVILLLFVAIFITGCAHPLDSPPLKRHIRVHLKLLEELPSRDSKVAAMTTCFESHCEMLMKVNYYPKCVVEEVGKITHQKREAGSVTQCFYK